MMHYWSVVVKSRSEEAAVRLSMLSFFLASFVPTYPNLQPHLQQHPQGYHNAPPHATYQHNRSTSSRHAAASARQYLSPGKMPMLFAGTTPEDPLTCHTIHPFLDPIQPLPEHLRSPPAPTLATISHRNLNLLPLQHSQSSSPHPQSLTCPNPAYPNHAPIRQSHPHHNLTTTTHIPIPSLSSAAHTLSLVPLAASAVVKRVPYSSK
jgi:hypothetical protein